MADTSLTQPPSQQACLTPPSYRRRQERIAHCAYVRAQAAAAAHESGDNAGTVGEEEPATAYAPEQVAQRRAQREAQDQQRWGGWEAEAEGYGGEIFVGELDITGMNEVDFAWEQAAPEVTRGMALGGAAADWNVPTLGEAHTRTTTGATRPSLPEGPTLGLLLCALYVLWRAAAAGSGAGRADRSRRQRPIRGKPASMAMGNERRFI